MSTPPIVSVITIFRNPPVPFFEAAIESVFAQTEARWELLLVDDGSTDASADVARRIAADHPDTIRLLHHPGGENRGMSASRNLGLSEARGQFVAFLDADDLYLPEKLERQLEVFARYPEVDIVYGPTLHWWSWTGEPADAGRDHPRRLGAEPEQVIEPPRLVRAFFADAADTPATCAVLIRRSAIDDIGGFEPVFVDLFEDQAFFYKLLLGHTAYLEAEAWDRYRRHPDALCEVRIREGTHSDDTRPTPARGRFLAWLDSYLDSVSVSDPALRRAVREQRWPFRHPRLYSVAVSLQTLARRVLPRRARTFGRRVGSSAVRRVS
jgi:glycosyltransferase involved in cell wall biosynthesis